MSILLENGQPALTAVDAQRIRLRHHAKQFERNIWGFVNKATCGVCRRTAAEGGSSGIEVKRGPGRPNKQGLSVDSIWEITHSLPPRKVMGRIAFPTLFSSWGGRPLAGLLSCICVKAFRRAEAPPSWNGGLMVTVHKKSDPRQCDGHRGMWTSSTTGKTYGNAMRKIVVPNLCQEARASQQGIIEGRCTEFAANVARLMMDRAALEGKSMAVLFVDAKSAIYSIAQERVLGARDQAKALADVLGRISAVFPKTLAARAREQVEQSMPLGPTLEKLGLADHLTHVLVDRHKHNWLAVEALDELAYQGTPLADIIFNLAVTMILREVEENNDEPLVIRWVLDTAG